MEHVAGSEMFRTMLSMKKTIYISGPITDNATGQPRKYWQEEFVVAEKTLHALGYNVINPVDIAEQTEQEWRELWAAQSWNSKTAMKMPELPTRATYVTACLEMMNTEALAGRLHGLWLLGNCHDPRHKQYIYHSHGVQMEMHMAKMLGIPMFAAFYDRNEVDIHLLPIKDGLRLCERGVFGKENWSEKL